MRRPMLLAFCRKVDRMGSIYSASRRQSDLFLFKALRSKRRQKAGKDGRIRVV
jgi:hypothetical protein